MIKLNIGYLRNDFGILRGFKTNRKDHHVKDAGMVLTVRCCPGKGKLSVHLVHPGDPGPYHVYPVFFLGPFPGFIKALAHGPDIHKEDGDIKIGFMLLGNRGLLYGIHAADR